MKKLELTIQKSDILSDVSLASAYAGVKGGTGETGYYERVSTTDTDAELLGRFWSDMCGVVFSRFREFITSSATGNDRFTLEMTLSGSYDESLTPSVKGDILSAVTAGVIARWFRYSLPARSAEWEAEAEELLKRAHGKLCTRRPPSRPF